MSQILSWLVVYEPTDFVVAGVVIAVVIAVVWLPTYDERTPHREKLERLEKIQKKLVRTRADSGWRTNKLPR